MAIPRVDISQEIADWQAAVYGEEVRSANVSALTKLQTQMNNACDGIETAQTDVATAVNTANAASATANQASSDAQDAIDDAQEAITTAQGYAANAEGSAQAAAASATAAQTAQTNAQTAQLAAEAAEQAAEDAARQAQIAINITPDEETIHHASDAVGTISAITYTLEEIAAMTDPSGKIPDASAVESLRESLSTLVSFQAVVAETISVPHGDYLSLQDYRPKDRTNYTWHLVGVLPSVGSIQIIGIDGSANRVMTLTDSKSTVSNARLVLTWCGIHN